MEFVYVFETPILNRDIERYRINIAKGKGFEIKILDISLIYQQFASQMIKSDVCDYKQYNVTQPYNKFELDRYILSHKDSFYMMRIGNDACFNHIYKMFYKYNIQYAVLIPESSPSIPEGNKRIDSFTRRLLRNPAQTIWQSVYKRIMPILNIQAAKYVIYTGNIDNAKYLVSNYKTCDSTQYLEICSNSTSEGKSVNRFICERYCLFIDQGLPWHPDLKSNNAHIDERMYLTNLNNFLTIIAKRMNLKVVIALHPRVEYPDNLFNPRFLLIKGKTHDLVQHANFVIYMFSEAFNYIMLYKKPILPITMNCIEKIYGSIIYSRPNEIGAKVLRIDDFNENRENFEDYIYYNESEYNKYTLKYINTRNSKPMEELLKIISQDNI